MSRITTRINDSPIPHQRLYSRIHNHCLDPLAQPRSAPFPLQACTLPPIPFQMARRSIDFLCTLAQPRNLIDFPLYIYLFEDRGCREIRFRACGIDQKKTPWKLDRFPSLYLLLLSSQFSSSGSFSRHQLKNHLLLSSSEMSSPKEGSAPTVSKLHWAIDDLRKLSIKQLREQASLRGISASEEFLISSHDDRLYPRA
ncbi:hypothetical protein LXL04_033353 [Taraxacum kok-saghyz]